MCRSGMPRKAQHTVWCCLPIGWCVNELALIRNGVELVNELTVAKKVKRRLPTYMSLRPPKPLKLGRRILSQAGGTTMEDDGKAIFEKHFGKPGEQVPAVDFADLKAAKTLMEDVRKSHPKGGVAIDMGVYQSVCSPGANVRAVWYRLSRLGLLEMMFQHVYSGGQWSDAAF